MNQLYHKELQALCLAAGFTKRGKAYFRIVGDGVLQVIKSQYERGFQAEELKIGLFSMYGDLLPQWFTSPGCIPRYSVMNCFRQDCLPVAFLPDWKIQIAMLRDRVMNWLNSIDNQKKLITAITKIEPWWNDSLKIGPYLVCGEHNHAKKVVREILNQHEFAWARNMEIQDYTERTITRLEQENHNLVYLLRMIDRDDPAEIDAYLKENYTRNMGYAKFCIK